MKQPAALHLISLLAFACPVAAAASEPSCFATPAAAVAQSGIRGVEGFRLEGMQRDAFSGLNWAVVRNCEHPAKPAEMVLVAPGTGVSVPRTNAAQPARVLVVQAGFRVLLISSDESSRVEVSAVAQASGAIGDRVRVRLLPVSAEGVSGESTSWNSTERFATGIVRSRYVLDQVAP